MTFLRWRCSKLVNEFSSFEWISVRWKCGSERGATEHYAAGRRHGTGQGAHRQGRKRRM